MSTASHLYGLNHSVRELEGSHRRRGAEGGRASLEAPDDAAVPSVLLDGQPDQVPEALH